MRILVLLACLLLPLSAWATPFPLPEPGVAYGSQPVSTSSSSDSVVIADFNQPSVTRGGFGFGYGARPPSGGSAANPGSESDNILGSFYNKTAVNGNALIDKYEHAFDVSWELSYRSTAGTNDHTWVEFNWDMEPPNNQAVLTSVDAGFNPTVGSTVTFSGGGTGVVISWDGGTDTLKWRQDYGAISGAETVTEAAGDGSDTAQVDDADVSSTAIADGWRPFQYVWDTVDHKNLFNFGTTPTEADWLIRFTQGAVGINWDSSLNGDGGGSRLSVRGSTRNTGAQTILWDSADESGVTSGNPVALNMQMDFSADASNDYNDPNAIRILGPAAPGASDIINHPAVIRIYDQGGYGGTGSVLKVDSQTSAGNAQNFGHILMSGGNWNTGNMAFGGSTAGDASDHFWRDQTNECFRVSTNDAPDNETDGPCLADTSVEEDTTTSVTVAVSETHGKTFYLSNTGVVTVTMPAAVAGMRTCFYDTDGTAIITIDVDASDVIKLDGTDLTAGNTIDSAGNAGDAICLEAMDATTWVTWNRVGTWADGGAT